MTSEHKISDSLHAKSCEIRLLANFLPQNPRRCRAFFRSASTACKDLRHAFFLALPLLSARCHLPMPGVSASSTAQPQRAGFRTVHASDLKILRNCRKPAHDRFACTRKTPVTSVTCGVGGRRFYLALFPSRCIATASTLPFARHCILGFDVVRSGQFVWLIARIERSRRRKCSRESATGVQRRCQRTIARLRLSCMRCAPWKPRLEPIS